MSEDRSAPLTDIAFTASVKAMQRRLGSRALMEKLESADLWGDRITAELATFLATRVSFYFGTSSADGQPYIQHRGGPPGFIEVVDSRHFSFPDYPGNRQYISLGNLSENAKAFVFLMDYPTKTRIKIWGTAWGVETAGGARSILFKVAAWDRNCRKYIPDLAPE